MPQQRCVLPHVAYSRELSFEQEALGEARGIMAEAMARVRREALAEGRAVEYWEPLFREAGAKHAPATAPEPDVAPPGFRVPDPDCWEPPELAHPPAPLIRARLVYHTPSRGGVAVFVWLWVALLSALFFPEAVSALLRTMLLELRAVEAVVEPYLPNLGA